MRTVVIRSVAVIAIVLGVAAVSGTATAADTVHAKAPLKAIVADDDPLFREPYVDLDEWRDQPVRHRYVHGGFRGTETRFSFYLPPKEQYQGRFFQYITPVPDSETLSQGATGEEDRIGFSIASGAYFIETNGGGRSAISMPGLAVDRTISAYRANAATARYSRKVALEMYGGKRPFGYAFGGSGGGFRTIGGMENTTDVWDGAVPYVIGSPMAIPNVFSVRMHAMRILQDQFPQLVDALEPGGSGDMYAGLDWEQRQALAEVTRMGFPPPAWFGWKTMGMHAFPVLYQGLLMADPGYFEDFWTVPGYLGANPPESLARARLQHRTTIAATVTADEAASQGLDAGRIPGQARGTADMGWKKLQAEAARRPVGFRLASPPPDKDFQGADLVILSGAAAGKRVSLKQIAGDTVTVGVGDMSIYDAVVPGDEVMVDNSNYLAAQTYHRHQVPGPDYPVWDQFRSPGGKPIYPQRPTLVGPQFAMSASGTVQSGTYQGKIIVVESLWDREAFPWQADWYRARVSEHLGERTDEHFRLWFTDRALHGDSARQEDPTRTVSYLGVLQQALRDVAAWVEDGVPPPANTRYEVVDGQVIVPPTAAERGGIQPVVTLSANGGERADVAAGEAVTLTAVIEVPPGTGAIVAAEWDPEGTGTFSQRADTGKVAGSQATITLTHRYAKPGTYFPVLRAASQRNGDADTPYARIQNLARARVVVR